jgi:uncharacterized protein (TIGR02118 family)
VIRWSVLYPKTEGATFDHDYYRDNHIPAVRESLGVSEVEIDRALDGPYVAAAHVRFGSSEEMKTALAKLDMKFLAADLPKYTTIAPQIQVSEIVG